MISNIYYSIDDFYKKKRATKTINQFDQAGSGLSTYQGWGCGLFTDGGITGAVSDLGIDTSIFVDLSEQDMPPVDQYGTSMVRRFSVSLISELLSSNNINALVKAYIGADARLDDIFIWKKNSVLEKAFDLSEGWHTDNVGKRIKLFICLDSKGEAPFTKVVFGSHLKAYKPSLLEYVRYFGKVSRDVKGAVDLRLNRGDFSLFDTNLLHRGSYGGEGGERTCLVLEFIDRHKSDSVCGLVPCGPGQSPTGKVEFVLDQHECDAQLHDLDLIDSSLLCEEPYGYSYSMANKKGN